MTADVEDNFMVAQANEPLDENGKFKSKKVNARYRDELWRLRLRKSTTWTYRRRW